ncbi:GGDEF domain-containing protein [Alteromonas sediminis]|uniref:diguanylate cyclase n=1 Tax=Alteromonas sediminis TaxID=2259342 RepID=A0A3N5ZDQ8_9ALTE|nr:GGDEF domain-containing protein [Alteromonas sediminis]RPJ68328.1 GGDEF domain-containing protein [Alteromonas sediminis]
MRLKSSSDLVGHIAGFTSLRDVDLLEMSLLKTVFTTLRPLNVSLISLDTNNIILKRIDYSSEQVGHVSIRIKADDLLLRASEQLDRSTKEYCTLNEGDRAITVYLLSQNRRVSHYICIEAKGNIVTQSDSYQIIGMLRVFQNFRALLTEAQTDELTGLPNRKAFNNVTEKIGEAVVASPEVIECDKRKSSDEPPQFWLALADLDNFKVINDSFGHLMGDEVLVRTAQTIQGSIREDDMVFRYGGEEFAILVSAKEKEQVIQVLERVRQNVEGLDFQRLGKITISIGFTEMKDDVFALTLVETADKALYQSKSNGKNQITYQPTLSQQAYHEDIEDDAELF